MPAVDEITRTVRALKKRGLWQNDQTLPTEGAAKKS
jgi:hypothetical protein